MTSPHLSIILFFGAIFQCINGLYVSLLSNAIVASLNFADIEACAEAPKKPTQR